MPIQATLYDSNTLLGLMRRVEEPSTYFRDLLFGREMTFEDEYIMFEKISDTRKLAPFVSPSSQGRPLYNQGSNVQQLKPAYIKSKDAVEAARMIKKLPGTLADSSLASPKARYDAIVVDILATHRNSIARRIEWLCAQAVLYGEVTIVGDAYPERHVDFGRAPAHTITKSVGQYWTPTFDIINDIETWRSIVRLAEFGGPTNRLTVGGAVWNVMRQNDGLLKLLDTNIRGTTASFDTGIREGTAAEYVGRLSGTLEVYVHSDYYVDEAGNRQYYMDQRDILLTGPGVDGVIAYGAILDAKAQIRPQQIFSKMWDQEDPSKTFLMSQSAPLAIPVNPNNTLRARVLA